MSKRKRADGEAAAGTVCINEVLNDADGEAAAGAICINEVLDDDLLKIVLSKLRRGTEKDSFGLVCKSWLLLQSSEKRRIRNPEGNRSNFIFSVPTRFPGIIELDLRLSETRFSENRIWDPVLLYTNQTKPRLKSQSFGDGDLYMATRFPNLRSLFIGVRGDGITDDGMHMLGNCLPLLQSLDVSCSGITDKGLESLSKMVHLEHLVLCDCSGITDSGLAALVGGCRNIKFLDVSRCPQVGDFGITRVSGACSSSLRTLKLLDCTQVGDESIYSLAESCKNLETLVIGNCYRVSNESIRSLATSCSSSLKKFRMNGCRKIDNTFCSGAMHLINVTK